MATPTSNKPTTTNLAALESFYHGCIPVPTTASKNDLPGTTITLHRMFVLVGLLCLILSVIGCFLNFCSHLIWRTNLPEQKFLMRISLLPFFFTIFGWVAVDFYGLGVYLDPLSKLYEVYCVASFYSFMVQVLTPNEATRDEYFVHATRMNRSAKKQIHDKGSLRWYKLNTMSLYISLFVVFVLTIMDEAIAATLCQTGMAYELYSVVAEVLQFFFTITMLLALIRLYRRFRKEYQGTKLLRKFWTFKSLVWLIIHQQIILEIVRFTRVVKPTKFMSEADFALGIPEFMVCCEGFLFSYIYMTTLSGLQYRSGQRANHMRAIDASQGSDASFWKYLLTAVLPTDVFLNFWQALRTLMGCCLGRKHFDYTGGTGVRHGEGHDSEASYPLNSYLSPEEAARVKNERSGSDSDMA